MMKGLAVTNGADVEAIPNSRRTKSHFDGSHLASIRKLTWLKVVVTIALICSFGLSWRLWVSSRLFPLSPIVASLPPIPFPFDYIWFYALVAILVLILIIPNRDRLILIFLPPAIILSLWDQNRWQPWFYQYVLMLGAMSFSIRTKSQQTHQQLRLNICRLIIVATYFWSGLQKLNANFVKETWPDIAGSLLRFLPAAINRLPSALVLAVPLLEIIIGLGLVTRRFRQVAVIFAILTHTVVLILLISSRENTVVWPWNLAMILFVVLLFWRDRETTLREIIVPRKWFHAAFLLLVAIMPACSLLDWWDSYLSSALYSGNTDQAVIYVSPAVLDRLPVAIHPHVWQENKPFFLDMNRWSYGELNVPLYPEPRVYKTVTERICTYAGNLSSDVKLRIKNKPNVFTAHRNSEYYDCDHLD